MTLARKLATGTLATTFGNVLALLAQVVTVPVFLWAWGTDRYGEWLTLYAAVAYLTLVDGGWTLYLVNRLTASHEIADHHGYQRALDAAFSTYVKLGLGVGAVLGLALVTLPLDRLLGLHSLTRTSAAVVLFLLGAQLIVGVPQGMLLGLYRTTGAYTRGAMVANGQRALLVVLTLIVLGLQGPAWAVALAQLVPVFAVAAYALRDLRSRCPWMAIRVVPVDWSLVRTFVSPSMLFAVMQLSMAVAVQGTVLIVNAALGAAAVAAFVTMRTLVNIGRQAAAALTHAAWPELIKLKVREADAKLRMAHRLLVKVGTASTLILAVILHFIGDELVGLWTGGRVMFDQEVMDVLLMLALAQAPWLVSSAFPTAFNQHRLVAWCYAGSAALGLALMFALVGPLGLVGVPTALLVADLIVCGWLVPTHVCRLLGDSAQSFWANLLLRGGGVLAATWICAGVAATAPSSGARMVLVTGAVCLSTSVLTFTVWLSKKERQQLVRLVRTVTARSSPSREEDRLGHASKSTARAH